MPLSKVYLSRLDKGNSPTATVPIPLEVSSLPLPTRIAFVGTICRVNAASRLLRPICATLSLVNSGLDASLRSRSTIRSRVMNTPSRFAWN